MSYGRTCRRGHKVVGENARKYEEGWRCLECEKRSNRVPTDPEDGVECLVCGDVMRNLGTHLISYHGITSKEYRERFPGAAITGPIFKAIRSDIEKDQAEDGASTFRKTKQAECKNGHPLKGRNVRIDKNGNRGCRACMKEYHRHLYHEGGGKKRRQALAKLPENMEKNRERVRRYAEENPERVRETNRKATRKWHSSPANKAKRNAWQQAYRERKKREAA